MPYHIQLNQYLATCLSLTPIPVRVLPSYFWHCIKSQTCEIFPPPNSHILCNSVASLATILAFQKTFPLHPSNLQTVSFSAREVSYFTYGSEYIYRSNLPNSPHPFLPLPHIHMVILYVCVCISALKIGSSVPSF